MRAVAWTGALMLGLSIVLQVVFPRAMGPLPPGLHTPVLALEIARSPDELETMFGAPRSPERAQWIAAVDRGNQLDFLFILVYGAFLILCARAFETRRPPLARFAIALALVAAAGDAVENGCLFAITSRLGSDYAGPLSMLIMATWLKWLSIATCLALLAPSLLVRGRWGKLTGWLAAATLPIALLAAALRGVAAETLLIAITLAFLSLWVEALRSRRAA
jgi:hypothetical protein